MTVTPELIDHVLSVVINHSGISAAEVAMRVGVDPQTALNALNWLWTDHEIERKTGRDRVVRWYDPEWPR